MRKIGFLKMLWVWLGVMGWGVLAAQTPADSVAFVQASWSTSELADGLVVRSVNVKMFHSDQRIVVMEVDPSCYKLAMVQDALRRTTSELGRGHGALAAINAGFFKMDTPNAVNVGYLRIGGDSVSCVRGSMEGAVAITPQGNVTLQAWNAGTAWHSISDTCYTDILNTTPVLLRDGRAPRSWLQTPQRHPRSAIGIEADGTVLLVAVDGRQKRAAGMTFDELSAVMRWLGAREAINLDGGGSTTLWSKKEGVLNAPCDHKRFSSRTHERAVANAIVVYAR